MSIADIIQIILSGLSLLATIAVSYSIYYLQRKHEKEIQKIEENLQKRKLKEKAVDGFCNTVEEKANEMIVMIRECSNIRNLF